MKKVLNLCVIIFLICTAFIPTINATTVSENYDKKIIEKISLIDSIEGKDDHISQNPYNITNFWDWFLFIFLPWFYSNFPNLFNLTLGSMLLLIVVFANFIDIMLNVYFMGMWILGVFLAILEKIFGDVVWDIVSIILGIFISTYEKIIEILQKIFGNPVEEIDIKLSKVFLLSKMKDNLVKF